MLPLFIVFLIIIRRFRKDRKQEIKIARLIAQIVRGPPFACLRYQRRRIDEGEVDRIIYADARVRWQDAHLDDTQAMLPGCVGSLNHSSTPRLKWVRDRASSIL